MPLAVSYAKRFFTEDTRFDFDDRKSVAFLALIKAADGYNPTLGFSFGTYAGIVIYRHLAKEAYKSASQVKRPSPGAKKPVQEMKQQALGQFAENRHVYDPTADLENRDHVGWILDQLDEVERAIAMGIMEGKHYAEMDLPTMREYTNPSSLRSRAAYIKKRMVQRIGDREFQSLVEYVRRSNAEE
jgi:hypothetical protein